MSSAPTVKRTTLITANQKDLNDNNSIIITAVICATVVVVVVVVVVAVVLVCCRLNRNKPQPFVSPSSVSSAPLVVDSSSFVTNSLCDFNKHMPRSGYYVAFKSLWDCWIWGYLAIFWFILYNFGMFVIRQCKHDLHTAPCVQTKNNFAVYFYRI